MGKREEKKSAQRARAAESWRLLTPIRRVQVPAAIPDEGCFLGDPPSWTISLYHAHTPGLVRVLVRDDDDCDIGAEMTPADGELLFTLLTGAGPLTERDVLDVMPRPLL